MMGFQDHGFNVSGFCMGQDLKFCDPILPFDVQDRAQALHVKVLKLFDVPSIQGLNLASLMNAGENDCCLLTLQTLVLISLSRESSLEMTLPRYVNPFTVFSSVSLMDMDGWWFVVG